MYGVSEGPDRGWHDARVLTTIAAGPIVFGEPMPSSGLGVTVRLLAFALVIAAAALTPPPASPEDRPGAVSPPPSLQTES